MYRNVLAAIFIIIFSSFVLTVRILAVDPPEPTATPTSVPTPTLVQVVDPAKNHPDKNALEVRGYELITNEKAAKKLIPADHKIDKNAPQLSTLIEGNSLPKINNLYQFYDWDWTKNARGKPVSVDDPKLKSDFASMVEFQTQTGQNVRVPVSGYQFGEGYSVVVLYATNNSLTIKYTPADSVAKGYTIHLNNLNVNPEILEYYNSALKENRDRLPALPHGFVVGTTKGDGLKVAIQDTGSFMDPRWENDWWVKDRFPKPSVTPTPEVKPVRLVKVAKEEVPFLDFGAGPIVGRYRSFSEQTEEACPRFEGSLGGSSVPIYRYYDEKTKTVKQEPEARDDAGLNYSTQVRGLHCGQAKGTPIVLNEISGFKLDAATLCGEQRIRKDESGKYGNNATGVWWAGEVGINYDNPERNFRIPFVEEMADIFAGSWDAEHMSEEDIDFKENLLKNPPKSITGANDPNLQLYLETKAEKDKKTGALKKLLPEAEIDVLKCGFVKFVNFKGGRSRYAGFQVDGINLSDLECPPIPAILNDQVTINKATFNRFEDYVYRGTYEEWKEMYGKAWDLMPVVPNERVSGDLKFEVCEDREYMLGQGYPEVMRFGLAVDSLWKVKTTMGPSEKDKLVLGTQEYFYQNMGYEDMRYPLESLLRTGPYIPFDDRGIPSRPVPRSRHTSPKICEAPRPENDTGWGFHGPLSGYRIEDKGDFDRVMRLAKELKTSWMTMYVKDTNQAAFAVKEANEFGIMPLIRPEAKVNQTNISWAGYVKAAQNEGVKEPYVQIYNEPCANAEWTSGKAPDSCATIFARNWVKAARAVYEAGGRPGIQITGREELDAVLRVIPKTDPLWQKVWFAWHGYATPDKLPSYEPNTEYEAAVLNFLRFGDLFQDRLGFVPPIIGTEGGYELKPPEGCAGSTAESGCVPIEAEKQKIAGYNQQLIDMFRTRTLPNGDPLPDYLLAFSPFMLTAFGAPDCGPGSTRCFSAFAWDSGFFDWSASKNVLRNTPQFQRQLDCQIQQQQQFENQRIILQPPVGGNFNQPIEPGLLPYLREKIDKGKEKALLFWQIVLKTKEAKWARDSAEDIISKKDQIEMVLQRVSEFTSSISIQIYQKTTKTAGDFSMIISNWPKVTKVLAQNVEKGIINGRKLLAQAGPSGGCMPLQAGAYVVSENPFVYALAITRTPCAPQGTLGDLWINPPYLAGHNFEDKDYEKLRRAAGLPTGPHTANLFGGGWIFYSNDPNTEGFMPRVGSVEELKKWIWTFTGANLPEGFQFNHIPFSFVDASPPYIPTSSSGCSSTSACCLNQDCNASCAICPRSQNSPSDTTLWEGENHILIGVNWGADWNSQAFIDPVRLRYKVPKYVPGQGAEGCEFTPYVVDYQERREARQAEKEAALDDPSYKPQPLPAFGTISCSGGGGCPGNAPYCGPGWVCGDFNCQATHRRVIDVYNNVPFLASAWLQIADPQWGFVSAYAKTAGLRGSLMQSPLGMDGCVTDENKILNLLGDFFDNPANWKVSHKFNPVFGDAGAHLFRWDGGFRVEQTSSSGPDSLINFYKTGGSCNSSMWWSKQVLNPEGFGKSGAAAGAGLPSAATTTGAAGTAVPDSGNPRIPQQTPY